MEGDSVLWSISQETLYAAIHSMVVSQVNSNKGQIYFPFISGLFVFILVNNLLKWYLIVFAYTSHFTSGFYLSFAIVLGATILGFQTHGLKFFSLLVPAGCF